MSSIGYGGYGFHAATKDALDAASIGAAGAAPCHLMEEQAPEQDGTRSLHERSTLPQGPADSHT